MDHRTFVASALALFAAPLAVEALQAAKVYRIGVLSTAGAEQENVIWTDLRGRLRERGWVEGRNLSIEWRYAEANYERLPALAAELVQLEPDLIMARGGPGATAARRATATIPIVMYGATDPVGIGLVQSLARPGGNVTGLSDDQGPEIILASGRLKLRRIDGWRKIAAVLTQQTTVAASLSAPELAGKQLQLLKEIVPRVSRVAVLWNPTNRAGDSLLGEAKVAARSLHVQLQILEARGPDEFQSAFAAMARERAGALLVFSDGMFLLQRTRITDFAAKSSRPAMYGRREFVDAGGLMSDASSLGDNLRRGAAYVDKILKGAKPTDLPVEQPTKFDLVFNLKTAKALGLTIPPSLLLRADQVIELAVAA